MQMTGNQAIEISLYFHIPFCNKKCNYCHFYVLPDKEPSKEYLLEGFKEEWKRCLPLLQDKTISTIYFGGGTPSLFGPARIKELIDLVKKDIPFASESIEITLETNPENTTLSLMKEYAQAGINRVSLGVQTLNNELLSLLGRNHRADTATQAVYWTAEAGIQNISIDLMYDIPKQTLAHWEGTLCIARDLPITHLSLYNLTIEPHTVFHKQQKMIRQWIPNEEVSLQMYETAIRLLEEKGLHQYEISAFAKPTYQSRHNVGYWTARPFLGLGPSAFSYWEGKRFRNIANLDKYCTALRANVSPIDFEEQLDPQAQLRELLTVQLRLKTGINLATFQQRHGTLAQDTIKTIESLVEEGWLEKCLSQEIALTKKGVLFYDTVASELI